jgi:hypothetical protein
MLRNLRMCSCPVHRIQHKITTERRVIQASPVIVLLPNAFSFCCWYLVQQCYAVAPFSGHLRLCLPPPECISCRPGAVGRHLQLISSLSTRVQGKGDNSACHGQRIRMTEFSVSTGTVSYTLDKVLCV